MDFFRRRFLWQEDQGIRKYHAVKWPAVCSPREIGGLGILDLEIMNIALLGKWLGNLENTDGMWQQVINEKYLSKHILAAQKARPGVYHFWQSLMELKTDSLNSAKGNLGMEEIFCFGKITG